MITPWTTSSPKGSSIATLDRLSAGMTCRGGNRTPRNSPEPDPLPRVSIDANSSNKTRAAIAASVGSPTQVNNLVERRLMPACPTAP
jgi:hypothetical protein